jgi:serine/threonine protein kinase/tetratricopeptide (TPR) repeat protein
MTPEQWQQVKGLFHAALERAPSQRAQFLAEVCAGDVGLHQEVASLLAAHEDAGSFIEAPAVAEATAWLADVSDDPLLGRRLGPYQILQALGHGGMGTVYLARRADDQYQKQVAIKLVKRGLGTEFLIRRFRTERQILASLDHPNIAKLLDGGTTEDGLPYLVMDYIEGCPIDAYCDRHRLPLRERLTLFCTVCAAVQYAHHHLIVHRDLKPSNILVTAEGVPKLLDFGIAKLLNPEQWAQTHATMATGPPAMTLAYASPEQIRGEPITTASDVYSLGVVLYELLTGQHPYGFPSHVPHDLARIICEEDPQKPSTALRRLGEVSTSRGTPQSTLAESQPCDWHPEKLRRRLAGDLDNIVLMALHKAPQRRYAAVEQLAEDIRRHLAGRPVLARPHTLRYRSAKFLQRCIGGVVGIPWQARVARAERGKAARRLEEVRQLVTACLFEFDEAIANLPGATSARAVLVNRALTHLDTLAQEARHDPSLQLELVLAYQKVANVRGHPTTANLGDSAGALAIYRKAQTIAEALVAAHPTHPGARHALAVLYQKLSDLQAWSGDIDAAVTTGHKSLALFTILAEAAPMNLEACQALALSHLKMGDVLGNHHFPNAGDLTGALQQYRLSEALLQTLATTDATNLITRRYLGLIYERLGTILKMQGDLATAMDSYRTSLALREAFAADYPTHADGRRDLGIGYEKIGDVLLLMGDLPGALARYQQSLPIFAALAAADPQNAVARRSLAISYEKLAEVLAKTGDVPEAWRSALQALPIREALVVADPRTDDSEKPMVGSGYTLFQLAKAFTTEAQHADPATRVRARQRIADWTTVFNGILNGTLAVGSRTPLEGVPSWVTLKILTGGFTTGELLAAGPLQAHERTLLAKLPATSDADARRVLNRYYLTDEGLAELQGLLQSGYYDVHVPEEGALLVVAWLVQNGYAEQARELLETLGPWISQLRFYPIPTERARQSGARVFLQDVGSTIESLEQLRPNHRLLAQKEAVCIWTPLYDRMVQLFLETVEGEIPSLQCDSQGRWVRSESGGFPVQGGWPCQHYRDGWAARATALLNEYEARRAEHRRCGRPERAKDNFARLRDYLRRCVQDPTSLQGRDVGRIRLILACYITKRGTPDSSRCRALREQQVKHASAPTCQEIAEVVIPRLQAYPLDEGLDDLSPITQPISAQEAEHGNIPAGTLVPESLQQKVQRCLRETVEVLVERGLITSGETLARVLPQMTAGVRAAGLADPALRRLFAAVYSAFRRRRSLLLLNLEKQVQLEDLPWVAAIDRFRRNDLSAKELARQTLEEVTLLTIASFPQALLPNKLLQELRALAKTAELDLPLVDEVAADIFMGEFSGKFLDAAKQTAEVLENTLYATYYGIDYQQIRKLQDIQLVKVSWFRQTTRSPFVNLCAARAGVRLGGWDPATNGMIIEQQQILTSQNLAVLFAELHLADALREQLADLARHCFRWICQRQQVKVDYWHARLLQMKNTAYAWRQMLFFLALLPQPTVAEFLRWAEEHLNQQPETFRNRFRPALTGLVLASEGYSLDSDAAKQAGARRFLGWSKTRHWLLTDV